MDGLLALTVWKSGPTSRKSGIIAVSHGTRVEYGEIVSSPTALNGGKTVDYPRSLHGIPVKQCLWCGDPFIASKGKDGSQKFCSRKCKDSYHNHHRREASLTTTQEQASNQKLREYVRQQEQALEYESGRRRQAERRVADIERILKTTADDLSVLIQAGVLTIDQDNPHITLLDRHDYFLRMMEDWSSAEKDLIDRQRETVEATRTAYRQRRQEAIEQGRPPDWIADLDKEYRAAMAELKDSCPQYWTWFDLHDMEDDHTQATGSRLPLDGTESEELRKRLYAGRRNTDNEKENSNEHGNH